MTRFLLPLFYLVLCSGVGFAVQPDGASPVSDAGKTCDLTEKWPEYIYYQINVDQLERSQTGTMLIQSALKIPFVAKQLAAVPESLQFLIDADVHSLQMFVGGTDLADVNGLLEIKATISRKPLLDLISHGRGYAKVEYRGVEIHHWKSDFDELTANLLGTPPSSEGEDQSLFMAMVADDHFLIGFGLAELNLGIDRCLNNEQVVVVEGFEAEFGKGENLFLMRMAVSTDVPGELMGVIREESDGRLVCRTSLKSRNETEREILAMYHGMLSNPKMISELLQFKTSESETSAKKVAVERDPAPNTKAAPEVTDSNKARPNRAGVNFGFMVDSHWVLQDSFKEVFESFWANCVKSEWKDDRLAVEFQFFMGPCIPYETQFTAEQAEEFGRRSVTNYIFSICSTAKKRDESIRKLQEIRTARAKVKKEKENLRR